MEATLHKSQQILSLKQLSIDLMTAWKNKDRDALDDLIHTDFFFVNDTIKNYSVGKEKWMEWLLEKFELVTFSYDFQKIEFIGEDKLAIVVSKLSTLSLPNYSRAQRQYLTTDILIATDGNGSWKLLYRQPVSSEFL